MQPDEFRPILAGVVDVVHKRTAGFDRVVSHEDNRSILMATATIIRGAKVLSAVNRAMRLAICFIESDGQHTHPMRSMVE